MPQGDGGDALPVGRGKRARRWVVRGVAQPQLPQIVGAHDVARVPREERAVVAPQSDRRDGLPRGGAQRPERGLRDAMAQAQLPVVVLAHDVPHAPRPHRRVCPPKGHGANCLAVRAREQFRRACVHAVAEAELPVGVGAHDVALPVGQERAVGPPQSHGGDRVAVGGDEGLRKRDGSGVGVDAELPVGVGTEDEPLRPRADGRVGVPGDDGGDLPPVGGGEALRRALRHEVAQPELPVGVATHDVALPPGEERRVPVPQRHHLDGPAVGAANRDGSGGGVRRRHVPQLPVAAAAEAVPLPPGAERRCAAPQRDGAHREPVGGGQRRRHRLPPGEPDAGLAVCRRAHGVRWGRRGAGPRDGPRAVAAAQGRGPPGVARLARGVAGAAGRVLAVGGVDVGLRQRPAVSAEPKVVPRARGPEPERPEPPVGRTVVAVGDAQGRAREGERRRRGGPDLEGLHRGIMLRHPLQRLVSGGPKGVEDPGAVACYRGVGRGPPERQLGPGGVVRPDLANLKSARVACASPCGLLEPDREAVQCLRDPEGGGQPPPRHVRWGDKQLRTERHRERAALPTVAVRIFGHEVVAAGGEADRGGVPGVGGQHPPLHPRGGAGLRDAPPDLVAVVPGDHVDGDDPAAHDVHRRGPVAHRAVLPPADLPHLRRGEGRTAAHEEGRAPFAQSPQGDPPALLPHGIAGVHCLRQRGTLPAVAAGAVGQVRVRHRGAVALGRGARLVRHKRGGADGRHPPAAARRHAARPDGAACDRNARAIGGAGREVVYVLEGRAGGDGHLESKGAVGDHATFAVPARHMEHADGIEDRGRRAEHDAGHGLAPRRVQGHHHHPMDAAPGVLDPVPRTAPRQPRKRPVRGILESDANAIVHEHGGALESGVGGRLAEYESEAGDVCLELLGSWDENDAPGAGAAAIRARLVPVALPVGAGRAALT